jgi:hypothetical protein
MYLAGYLPYHRNIPPGNFKIRKVTSRSPAG